MNRHDNLMLYGVVFGLLLANLIGTPGRTRSKRRGWIFAVTIVYLFAVFPFASANSIDEALEASDSGVDFLEVALTGIYQHAVDASADTGNYEVDLIGSLVLRPRKDGTRLGGTNLVFWLFSVDNLGGLEPTGSLRRDAGLLWDTNDINVENSVTQFGVFGITQYFFQNRLELGVGKVFPGMIHTESPYTANNSETFMSKIIAASAVSRYFEAIGLGANAGYRMPNGWFVQGGFSDAKAEAEFDFSSLADGVLASTLEIGWAPEREVGMTSVSVLTFAVDETEAINRETGFAVAFSHDIGAEAWGGMFGRYTYRSGGDPRAPKYRDDELPLEHGGFLGYAWNAPFGRETDQLGIAAMVGQPSDSRREQGFSTQYGVTAFWSVGLWGKLRITPSAQFLSNIDGNLEMIFGLRLKGAKDFSQVFH